MCIDSSCTIINHWETLRHFGKLSSEWLDTGKWVCVLGPSMQRVTLPLQWDKLDARALGKEVVYIIKNNCKYRICRFG